MNDVLTQITSLAESCQCGNHHNEISIEKIVIDDGALKQSVSYIKTKKFKKVALIADEHTYQAAGEHFVDFLKDEDIPYSVSLIQADENNDVAADEAAIVQVLIEAATEADVFVAIGSGTIHDIVRFSSYKLGKPFISIPTAPSVDGFASMGAPLVIRGVKKTYQTAAPLAIFADLAVLENAPKKMIAAGFGDMMAKHTSLLDWKFGHLVANEPYCPLVAQVTLDSLESCVKKAELIAKGDKEGIRILMKALIHSGLAMLIFGQSHPASGGEHHLSHYWEMEFLRQKRPQVLHGAKVGASTPLLADIYIQEFLSLLSDSVKLEQLGDSEYSRQILNKITENKQEIVAAFQALPEPLQLRNLIKLVGGQSLPEQLGIDNELIKASLNEAHHLRDRFTVLKFLNEIVKIERKFIV